MQDNFTTYRGVRIDDTAEWRLVIYLSVTGMSAYLKNIEDPLEPMMTLFAESWNRDEKSLLSRIEQGVYDHPQVMDDFSTDIVVCTPHTVWVPEDVCREEEDAAAALQTVYPSVSADDIVTDLQGTVGAVFTLAPGLPSFLRRTLSGARVRSHQSVLMQRFASRGGEMPMLYVDIREGEADYILLDDRKLLLAVTHPWHDPMDIAYMVFNTMEVYGLKRSSTQVSLSGLREVKQQLLKQLREQVDYVMLTMLPSGIVEGDIPLAAAFALTKNK